MYRILKFTIAPLIAIILLGGSAGIVLAQPEGKSPEQRAALMSKVSDILDIDQQKLESAFKQAQQEQREGSLDQRFNELVTAGTITQQQADELKAWMDARPDVPIVGPRQLKKLSEDGKLTQQQADALKAWQKSKPEDTPGIRPKVRRLQAEKAKENRDALMTRVANILGIDKQRLVDAFEQAQQELRGQALDTKLQELVQDGVITQQQADAYNAWMKSRPDMPRLPMLP